MANPKNTEKGNLPKKPFQKPPKFNLYWIYGIILFGFFLIYFYSFYNNKIEPTSQNTFINDMLKKGDVDKIVIINKEIVHVYIKQDRLSDPKYKSIEENQFGSSHEGPHYSFQIGDVRVFSEDLKEAQESMNTNRKIDVEYTTRKNWGGDLISWLIFISIFVVIWIIIMRRMGGGSGGPGGQIFNIGKSKATLFDKENHVSITFGDVAGLEEAKEEVKEVVDFLKHPDKYTSLGGKIPKGVLLVGPPGTGKTLLAKAMAGEAQVPFFTISGSDFVELFVGVGASRVRDLFKQAREKAPCIIFIDEIDAIGRTRGRNMIQGNDERENTLNQLLVEMDGFSSEKGVIILAATNRPDVLDHALLRPGRFDRLIGIDKPDLIGREEIFKVHLKPIKISKNVDPKKLAAQTPGFAGAEIANACNEAALIGARREKKKVDMLDFQEALDRVIGGLEKKNKLISPDEKEIIAYHEAGHAICGWFLEHAHPLVKVSIVPRGIAALGFAQYLPKEQYLYTTEQLLDEVCMTLGGRAAEEIIFGKITTGAQNDLEKITKLIYAMVTIYGMNPKIGNVSFHDPQNEYSFNKPYSEGTAHLIDNEVKNYVDNAYKRSKKLLAEKKTYLIKLAKKLLEKEVIFQNDVEKILGKRPFEEPSTLSENGTPSKRKKTSKNRPESPKSKSPKDDPAAQKPEEGSDLPEIPSGQ